MASYSVNESDNKTDELTFHDACAQGNLSVVKVYMAQREFDMNIRGNWENTGFHYACFHGNLNVVDLLLQEGFDMNVRGYLGNTGFHQACAKGNLNVVQFLVQKGFDINVGDDQGITGFHDACSNGTLNVVEFLIQEGFDMNVVDNDGHRHTGFHDACANANLNVVKFILQQGFQGINQVSFGGKTGLKMLIDLQNELSDDKRVLPCILLLIEFGAELDKNDVFEELICAIHNRIFEITFVKQTIFKKWTGRIAKTITNFTIDPLTKTSLQNLSQFLWTPTSSTLKN